MAPLSHAWLVFLALVAVGEASVGDRSWLFIDCLDICVEKMCGITYVREELDFELTRAEIALQKRFRNGLHHDLAELELSRSQQQPGLAGPSEPTMRTTGAFVAGVPGDAAARPEERRRRRRRLLGEAGGASVPGQERNAGLEQGREEEEEEHHHQHQPQQRWRRQPQLQTAGGGGDKLDPAGAGAAAAAAAAGALSGGGGAGADRAGGGESVREGLRAASGLGDVPADTPREGVVGQVRRALTAEDSVAGGKGTADGQGGAGVAVAGAVAQSAAAGAVDRYVHQPPWHLRAMGWDCESECKHMCMKLHVEMRAASGSRMVQYYGKWPFRRVWGIQELFASLFSAGNGLPHLYHVLFSKGLYNPPGNYMRFWLTLYPWVGMNTWLWSTVFHARDVPWTEAADYFCALLNIFYVVWIALVRLAGPPVKRGPRARRLMPMVGVSMSIYYLLHISFMWFVKFDYGYNMKVALLAGVAHTGLWLRYLYLVRDRSYAKRGATIIILLNAAILLEVNDFPPLYRLLDAHAIWHFVTIPLMFCWYRFVIQDARHEVSLASKET